MRLEEVKRMLPRCFYYHREFIGSTPVIWVFLLPAPPHRVNASCYTIDKALNDEYLIPKKFEAHPAYLAGSFFYVHQLEQPGCKQSSSSSIKPPSDLNKKASTFLGLGTGPPVNADVLNKESLVNEKQSHS